MAKARFIVSNPKRSRTAIPEGGIRSHPAMGVRMSPEDKAAFQAAANADGYKSLSAWFRAMARARLRQQALEAQELEQADE